MLIPIRCYAVMAGTSAADPLGTELVRALTREAAERVAAALQAQARARLLLGGAQYFVLEVDEELDLGVADAAQAVREGYTVRATAGDTPLVVGAAGAATDHLELARRREERAAEAEPGQPEPDPVLPVGGDVVDVVGGRQR